jgi:hypothetical protein
LFFCGASGKIRFLNRFDPRRPSGRPFFDQKYTNSPEHCHEIASLGLSSGSGGDAPSGHPSGVAHRGSARPRISTFKSSQGTCAALQVETAQLEEKGAAGHLRGRRRSQGLQHLESQAVSLVVVSSFSDTVVITKTCRSSPRSLCPRCRSPCCSLSLCPRCRSLFSLLVLTLPLAPPWGRVRGPRVVPTESRSSHPTQSSTAISFVFPSARAHAAKKPSASKRCSGLSCRR